MSDIILQRARGQDIRFASVSFSGGWISIEDLADALSNSGSGKAESATGLSRNQLASILDNHKVQSALSDLRVPRNLRNPDTFRG